MKHSTGLLFLLGALLATSAGASQKFIKLPDLSCLKDGAHYYRSYDGSCNNLVNSDWGVAGSTYQPGVEGYDFSPEVAERGNPRTISNRLADIVCPLEKRIERKLTLINSVFGQFLTHDISSNAVNFGQSPPLELEDMDDFFLDSNVSIVVGPSTGVNPGDGQNAALNSVSAFADLSVVYGNDEETAHALRTMKDGKLKTRDYTEFSIDMIPSPQNEEPLTVEGDLPNFIPTMSDTNLDASLIPGSDPEVTLSTGDVRVEQNVGLTMIHLLFLREHNRVAEKIKKYNRYWSDEKIFQHARKFVIAEYQHILYNEYLPSLLGGQFTKMGPYKGYNDKVHPQLTNSFETVAFRYGHSTVPNNIPLYDDCGQKETYKHNNGDLVAAGLAAPNPVTSLVLLAGGPKPIIRGLCYFTLEEVDVKVSDALRNINIFPNDLLASNIQRGRFNGVPNYDVLRKHYRGNSVYSYPGCTKGDLRDSIECFYAITPNNKVATKLQRIYRFADKIDPLVGILAEEHVPGSSLGATAGVILAKQFDAMRSADRFYYENNDELKFWPHELNEIKSVTLSKLLELNFGLKVQHNVFYAPEDKHDFISHSCYNNNKY